MNAEFTPTTVAAEEPLDVRGKTISTFILVAMVDAGARGEPTRPDRARAS